MAFETVEARFRGDTIEFDVLVTLNGVAFNITDADEIWCTGKTSADQLDDAAVFQKKLSSGDIAITDGPGGALRVRIAPADTSSVVITNDGTVNVQCDVAIKMPAADQFTVKRFVLPLIADITRATV